MEKKTETEETVTPRSLETVRLLIRPFQEEDADAFFACCQNPNLGNNAGWAPHKTIEESRKILPGCVYRPREYLGDDTERCAATYRFYRNRPRPETGESTGPYAGVLA